MFTAFVWKKKKRKKKSIWFCRWAVTQITKHTQQKKIPQRVNQIRFVNL